jgi:hypothetical protein
MLRKLLTLACVLAFAFVTTGCAENEHEITTKKETEHESDPQDQSPGEMVVE